MSGRAEVIIHLLARRDLVQNLFALSDMWGGASSSDSRQHLYLVAEVCDMCMQNTQGMFCSLRYS